MKWTRKNGETIDMKDMNDAHLYNALKLTKRRLDAGEYLWTVGPYKKIVIPDEMFKGLKAEVKRREVLKEQDESTPTRREPLTLDQLTEVGVHFVQKQMRKFHGPECTCIEDAYKETVQQEFDWEVEIDRKFSGNSKVKEFAEKVRTQAKEEERADILEMIVSNLLS